MSKQITFAREFEEYHAVLGMSMEGGFQTLCVRAPFAELVWYFKRAKQQGFFTGVNNDKVKLIWSAARVLHRALDQAPQTR